MPTLEGLKEVAPLLDSPSTLVSFSSPPFAFPSTHLKAVASGFSPAAAPRPLWSSSP